MNTTTQIANKEILLKRYEALQEKIEVASQGYDIFRKMPAPAKRQEFETRLPKLREEHNHLVQKLARYGIEI